MSKKDLLTNLSESLGFETEYEDSEGNINKLTERDISLVLSLYGFDTKNTKSLKKTVSQIEIENYKNILPEINIIKSWQNPVLTLNIPIENENQKYEWTLEKESKVVEKGKFIPSNLKKVGTKFIDNNGSYSQYELNINKISEEGYYKFKVKNQDKRTFICDFIVVPQRCYNPIKNKNQKIIGPKFSLSEINFQYGYAAPLGKNVRNLIRKISDYETDVIGLGPINQTSIKENGEYNPYLPSNRMFLDTLFLDTEEILNFIEDKRLQIRFLSREFQEQYEELEKQEVTDYKAIFDIKFKKYKLIYESFREIHMKKNTFKAKRFYLFVKENKFELHKFALFRALQDFLSTEDAKYLNWHEWPKPYQDFDNEVVMQFEKNNKELIDFYKFLQWQSHIQFKEAIKEVNDKDFSVGIYTELPFCIDFNGAETWIYRDNFVQNASIKIALEDKSENKNCPALMPSAFAKGTYSYFIKLLRSSMYYSNAINLINIEQILNPILQINKGKIVKKIKISYNIEDLLGIIALESNKNKCMITTNLKSFTAKQREIFAKYGIFDEEIFDFQEIKDEKQFEKFCEKLKTNKTAEIKTEIEEEKTFGIAKIPNSTYRLQFNKDFTFMKAKEIIPYLKKLGISHVYSSPLLSPKKGSKHGYDIVNHNKINQEAGTYEEFGQFVNELHKNGIGLILDIVPNHMGIGKENKWWTDVLENGPSSEYAHYFDIDWDPLKKELAGKVLLPVLGESYGNVLVNGQIVFSFDPESGKLSANYYDNEFPLNPSTYPVILEYRIDVLKARLGTLNKNFQEYMSIITVFKNLPEYTNTDYEKIAERSREKNIAFERLADLYHKNHIIKSFIEENLVYFKCSPDDAISIDRVHNLLDQQPYRLALWRVSADEINYRRFFDVNDLAVVCVEKPDVFTNTHSFILNLIEDKKIDGLRVDHPDGLLEPTNFYKRLQQEIAKKIKIDFNINQKDLLSSEQLPFYVVTEKILAPFEKIPSNWAIQGSVGYDFLNSVNELFVKSSSSNVLTEFYYKFIGKKINFDEMVIECKKLIMNTSFAGELNVLSHNLSQISEMYLSSRDYTLNSLRNAIVEVISCFSIYRTYISGDEEIEEYNKSYINKIIKFVKKRSPVTDVSIFDFIEKILLLELEKDKDSEKYQDILKFTLKFQQYTGPLMAKAFEDTFFYRYNRLISLNEVGSNPQKFGSNVEEFHQQNLQRMDIIPNSMLTTSTHDTKRSEDLRARICAISEIQTEWQSSVRKWHNINKQNNIEIDKNDEYLIYQTLMGIWGTSSTQDLERRLKEYILKASREAKVHTSWVNINEEYENSLQDFIAKILNYPPKHAFWKDFLPLQEKISFIGYLNSLSQCVLKLTSPGVPDIYQGNEIFKHSLVDPDNRTQIDYLKRINMLEKLEPLIKFNPEKSNYKLFEKILLPVESGLIKLFYTTKILNLRNKYPDLFKYGKYIPLDVSGKYSEKFVAFARWHENKAAIIIVPRLFSELLDQSNLLNINKEDINDAKIELPTVLKKFHWIDINTKQKKTVSKGKFSLSELLNVLPIAVIYGQK